MEQVLYGDLDLFLIQMKKRFGKGTENGQKFLEDTYQEDYGMGFSIQIPKEFEQADAQSAAAVFWSEKRPPVILITPKREEGLTFQFLSEEMAGETLSGCRRRIKQLTEQIDERCVYYDMGEETGTAWFDYKSFAKSRTVYNLIFLFQAGGKKILGTFYCIFEKYDIWKPMILKMLSTIRTKEEIDERL
ncbi:hypothetical protein IMSAGC005_02330 [Lachnospiraceae bacterium]|nr:hypothetical protein IMSAGC005_02330 [Lachnospiraceae bacterium]